MVTPGPDRRFFDLWSRFYDASIVQRLTYRPVHDAVLRALRARGVRRVLDVGCGTGLLTDRISRRTARPELVGCDFSRGMLERAARRAALPWVQADAQRLPFRDRCFEAVVSTEAFHWFPDAVAALAEFFRVLEPGGCALIALVNPPSRALGRAFERGSRWLGEPFSWPTRAEMRGRLQRAGFRVQGQQRIFRIPGGLLLPPVLTIGVRPAAAGSGAPGG